MLAYSFFVKLSITSFRGPNRPQKALEGLGVLKTVNHTSVQQCGQDHARRGGGRYLTVLQMNELIA